MNKFRISRTSPIGVAPWWLRYPTGFNPDFVGVFCTSFDEAVREFARLEPTWCLMGCGRGTVVDTDIGWECTNCGASDTAAGQ